MLACLRAGAVLLPLNTAYTLAELEYFLSDAKPALILCRPAVLEAVRALWRTSSDLPAVESLGAAPRRRLCRAHRGGAAGICDRCARRRRSRRDPLYVGHHRTLEGRHADA